MSTFTAPSDVTKYKPDQNTLALGPATVLPQQSGIARYNVTPTDAGPTPPFLYAAPKTWSVKRVEWNAGAWGLAYNQKFLHDTVTDTYDPTSIQDAMKWYVKNVLNPFWGVMPM